MTGPAYPFSAVVGADHAKIALVLAAIDPNVGGVLLRGEKGSAKTTLARGLAALLPGDAPFVELPLGASEERVVGTLDLAAVLTEGAVRFQSGLLATAHGGVLYVDEVNLLADHLVDVLLDVAVSGINRVERDHLSHEHQARFVLIGSMNPEEGDLRPQLLDRFGLCVDVTAPVDSAARAEVVRRRLAYDRDRVAFAADWAGEEATVADQLATVRPATLDDDVLTACAEVCATVGAEGMRGDITLARAAAAHAGWAGRRQTTLADTRAVAPFVLAHRARRHPLDPPGPPPDLGSTLDEVLGSGNGDRDEPAASGGDNGSRHADADAGDPAPPSVVLQVPKALQPDGSGRRSTITTTTRGRAIGHRPAGAAPAGVAVVSTVTSAVVRRASGPSTAPRLSTTDLQEPVRETKVGNLLVLAVDASASMGAQERMRAVKGALLGLLEDAYQRRDRVSLVTFGEGGATVVLRPTGSVEIARARLEDLPTGGDTPLAEGIRVASDLAIQSTTPTLQPLLVLVTDGRATAGADPLADALAAATRVARRRLAAAVIDVEPAGRAALGLAPQIAAAMAARLVSLAELTAGRLESTIRSLR